MSTIDHSVAAPSRRLAAGLRATGRDAAYLLAVLGMSIADFWILTACVITTVVLLPTVIGVVAGVGCAYVLRGLAHVDRRLTGWYLRRPIRGRYRRRSAPGVVSLVKTVGGDPRTWKDAGWTLGNSVAGFALGLISLVAVSLTISYITTPLWWWAVPHPHDNYAVLNLGLYTVTSTPLALITCGIGLALAPLTIALNRRLARVHARMARAALED